MPTASRSRSVDLEHLARYTGGDAALNAEVLQLFATQSVELLDRLAALLRTKNSTEWRHVTHTVKGAARGIGAFELADAAADAESMDPAGDTERAAAALLRIRVQTEAVSAFIHAYLGQPQDG